MMFAPVDPRAAKYQDDHPNYWVIFWSQPHDVDTPSEQLAWHSSEFRISGAKDVHEVIAWASADEQHRIYTLYAESKGGADEIVISRLAGHDPTVSDRYSYFVVGGEPDGRK